MLALIALPALALGAAAAPASDVPPIPLPRPLVTIHPKDAGLCLTHAGQQQAIKLAACDGSRAQMWDVDPCDGQVRASNTTDCLQAGWNPYVGQWFPASGMTTVLQACRDEPGFSWVRNLLPDAPFEYEHTQDKIGARLCLDWKDGRGENVQTWVCAGNDNQRWSTQTA